MSLRIALLPLDERPVNTSLARDVGALAGAELLLPPGDLLPVMRRPGDVVGLAAWLLEACGTCDAAVVSLDLLLHGGLIASRTTHDPTVDVLGRLEVLHRVRVEHPGLDLAAVGVVMRASKGYSADEEPDYWARWGVEIHDHGGVLHEELLADAGGAPGCPSRADEGGEVSDAPAPGDRHPPLDEAVADHERRRLRNHIVNLEALRLAADGVLDTLLVTTDDTAPRSAGSAEQLWLRHWRRALGLTDTVQMYPGADEVAATLVARSLVRAAARAGHAEPVRVRVAVADERGLDLTAPYENEPMRGAIRRQILATGSVPQAGDARDPDVVLVVHTPSPGRADWCGTVPVDSPDAARATARILAREALAHPGSVIVLADCRHTNGGDPALVTALVEADLLGRVDAYAGWNTAGNTLGSVLSAGVSLAVGSRLGTRRPEVARRVLLHRLLEDVGYQAVVRTDLMERHGLGPELGERRDPARVAAYLADVRTGLTRWLAGVAGDDRWAVENVRLPWGRAFEVDFDLRRINA